MPQMFSNHPVLLSVAVIVLVIAGVAVFNFLYIKYSGKPVAIPDIPREVEMFGSGEPLMYVVLGDSTAVGQGGDYEVGIARSTAAFMAKNRQVKLQNLAVSGATAADVLKNQVDAAAKLKPGVALLAVGANNVTHLTSTSDIKRDMASIIDTLRAANPSVKIILTGSPEMGSVPRFAQPLRYYAGVRTAQVNKVMQGIAAEKSVTLAPIAAETGPIFSQRPELFAQDLFHPNNEGYGVWIPVLHKAIRNMLVTME